MGKFSVMGKNMGKIKFRKKRGPYQLFFKRFFDFILSLIALIILLPIMIIVYILSLIILRGNPIFKQYRPGKNNRIFAQAQERNQAQILKTYSFKMSGNIEDEVKFELLNTILGGTSSSRLFSDLREKQKLAYAVSSQVQSFGDTGILTCQILTTTDNKEQNEISYDNVQKSLEGFKKHTELLKNEKVTTQELENAKKVLKQNIIAECELPYSETQLLAVNANLPYGIKRIDEYFKTIDKITVEDIQIAANHVFSNNSTISIVASEDTLKNQKKYLQDEGNLYM